MRLRRKIWAKCPREHKVRKNWHSQDSHPVSETSKELTGLTKTQLGSGESSTVPLTVGLKAKRSQPI